MAVILLVLMRSPMYFCRNLLLLSSLSCSSLTASMRLNIAIRDSWSAFACLLLYYLLARALLILRDNRITCDLATCGVVLYCVVMYYVVSCRAVYVSPPRACA